MKFHVQFNVMEEDLTHYRNQPDRLIEEFQKLKTAKKKAEEFAVEAKQSAQKVKNLSLSMLDISNVLVRENTLLIPGARANCS